MNAARSAGSEADRLTRRERECLRLVYQGRTSKQIAQQLGGLGWRTVDDHIASAKQKLGARTRGQAAARLHEDEAPVKLRTEPGSIADTRILTPVGEAPIGLTGAETHLRDHRPEFKISTELNAIKAEILGCEQEGRRTDLSITARLVVVVRWLILALVGLGLGFVAIDGLGRFGTGLNRNLHILNI